MCKQNDRTLCVGATVSLGIFPAQITARFCSVVLYGVKRNRRAQKKKTIAVKTAAYALANGIGFRSNWCLVSWKLKQQVVALVVCASEYECLCVCESRWLGWQPSKMWRERKKKTKNCFRCNERSFAKSFTNNCRLCQSAIGWFPSSR